MTLRAPKNIAINLLLVSPKSATGSFVYVKNLLDSLFKLDRDNFYLLILNSDNYNYFKEKYGSYGNIAYYLCDIRRDIAANPFRAFLKLMAKARNDHKFKEKIIGKEIQEVINKNKIKLMFFSSGAIYPAGLKNIKTITIILDLQHEYFPDNFSKEYLGRRKSDSEYAAHNSDHIIAISDFTKKSIVEKYKVNPDKISVVYLAPQELKSNQNNQLKLPENFIFYPAAIWLHKNHKILIEALNLLKFKFPELNLVFTGVVKNKKLKEELDALVGSYSLDKRVYFLGFVPDENMPLIYEKAKILIYPSSFEGFGIPVVEAFKFGLPVIAADNTSIKEIVGTAGVLVETGNIQALADAIERVLSDKDLRQDLTKKGHERAKDFSWLKIANETIELFNSL